MNELEVLSKIEQILDLFGTKSNYPESILKKIDTKLDNINELIKSHQQTALENKKNTQLKIEDTSLDETIYIWSDGACSGNPGPGGWGTVIKTNDQYFELSGSKRHTTNNVMEMTGALEGLKKTKEGSSIVLTSDSQYLIKGMTLWIKNWKKRNWKKADGSEVANKEIWVKLDETASKRKIKWLWTKGHADDPMNEKCDELARNAII